MRTTRRLCIFVFLSLNWKEEEEKEERIKVARLGKGRTSNGARVLFFEGVEGGT